MPLIKTLALTGLLASQGLAGAIPQTLSLENWIKTGKLLSHTDMSRIELSNVC